MTTTRPSRLQGYRQRRDEFMRTNEHSPLTDRQRNEFVPLDYFEENPDLVFVLDVDRDVPTDPVELPTTSGETKPYQPYGRVTFEVDGQPATLMVYREPERGRLILPFRDGTCGQEVYGAGRTVDPQERPDGKLSIDFNYAYGPYCQYNDNWVCTIPPMENWLRVPIRAGEKRYPGKESSQH
ncbi:MAG TPA: DUF1684 domain-containing protein [Thermomicrobiales bacterium]|nr:DUF1684 domain-containing protein [Thermomicrobiales bacterium]